MTPLDIPVLTTVEAVEAELKSSIPVLVLLWADQSPRREAEIALKEAVDKYRGKLKGFLVDARDNTALADRFNLGTKPVLIGWYAGQEHVRRSRPWQTDVTGIAGDMVALIPVDPDAEEEAPPAMDDKPVTVTTETFVEKVIQSPLPVIVDFWATWCQPCKMVAPILEKLAKEFAGKIRIAKIDVDANQALAGQFGIQSIPTLMFVKNGKIVGQSAGAAPEPALRDVIRQLIALEV